MDSQKKGMFVLADGRNVAATFILVSSLFLLWGFCNGMIDVMDKHFQQELHLTLAQFGVGAVCPLSRLLPDGAAGRLAGDEAGLQGRHHRRAADGGGGRALVHPRDPHRGLLGVPARRLHHRRRPDLPRDRGQSLHHRARPAAIRGHPHQPRPVVQRHRLDFRADRRRDVLLWQGRRGCQHRQPDPLDPLRRDCGAGHRPRGDLLLRRRARHQDGRCLPPGRQRPRRVALDLGPPAFCLGRGRAVPLCRGAGRHLQLLHQLHDLASATDSGVVAVGHDRVLV